MPVENSEVKALIASQANVGKNTGNLARTVVRKTALDIVRDAKAIAHQKFSPEATGATANSISATDLRTVGTSGDLSVEIGPTTYYAFFVENGTSRMAAKPFMGPAADRNEPAFVRAMEIIAEEALG